MAAYEAARLFHEGLELAGRGDFPRGVEKWRESIQADPSYPEPHGHLGWFYLRRNNYNLAHRSFSTLTQLVPDNAGGHFHLALALAALDKEEEARREYGIAVSLLTPDEGALLAEWKRQWKAATLKSPLLRLQSSLQNSPFLLRIVRRLQDAIFYIANLKLLSWYAPIANRHLLPKTCLGRAPRFRIERYLRFVCREIERSPRCRISYARIAEAAIISEALGLESGKSIIDVGTGLNPLPLYWAWHGMRVVCTDPDDFLLRMNPTAARLGLDDGRVEFLITDGASLPYPDNSFDYWTSVSVVEHIPGDGDSRVMREAARVLKPGGIAVLTTEASRETGESWYRTSFYFGKQYTSEIDNVWKEALAIENPVETIDHFEESESTDSFALLRNYDRRQILDRLVKPSGLEIVEIGFVDSRFKTDFRYLSDPDVRTGWSPILADVIPLLSYWSYRRLKEEDEHRLTGAATAYVILRKPLEQK